jgi:glycosyltransferase involved in cell wall biosynthesis
MRIVYFYQYFSTLKGSWGTRVYEFGSAWAAAGHEVTVVSAVYSKSDLKASRLIETQWHNGIKVKVINVKIDNTQSFFKRILSFLKYVIFSSWYALTLPADLVIASSGPITVGVPGLLAHYIRRRKLIFEVRDLWPAGAIELGILRNRFLIRWAYAFEKKCYQAAKRIITLSPGMSEDIERRYGFTKQTSITNGANIALFGTRSAKRTEFTNTSYAIYTGNIGMVNNSRWLLDAARYLKKMQRSDIIILLVGEGQERQLLEQEAEKERLTNFVRLDLMPKEDLVAYVQQSMASLVPLKGTPVLDSSSPNKFFESLAAGVPVIQNTNGWMKDFLETHRVGFTIDPQDAGALGDRLIWMSDHPSELKEMGVRARQVADTYFNKDILAQQMLTILKDVHAEK